MPIILVTNDDGIHSEGLTALYEAMMPLGDVYVVAPESEQSAVGHALTLHRPLKPHYRKENIISVNGTPTDCVALAIKKLLPQKPDLVVSGINRGGNLGDDITYSGTVSAAMEGALLGVSSVAFSLLGDEPYDFKKAAKFAFTISQMVLCDGLPEDTLLNVNVPNTDQIKGVKMTQQGKRRYDNSIRDMLDPWGRQQFWIGGGTPRWEQGEETDFHAVREGFISITPIHLNLTNFEVLDLLKKKWQFSEEALYVYR